MRKIFLVLLCTGFMPIIFASGTAHENAPAIVDTCDAYSISELKRLGNVYNSTSQEPIYWQALLKKGNNLDSVPVINDALHGLVKHYYYMGDKEMVRYWDHYTDSLVRARKLNPDVYYEARRNSIIFDLVEDSMGKAITEIIDMFNLAQNTSQEYGMVCGSELLGIVYQTCDHDSAALAAFQEANDKLNKIGGHLTYQLRLATYLIEMQLRLNALEEAEASLAGLENLLQLKDEENKKNNISREKNWYRWSFHSLSADLYLKKNQLQQAESELKKAGAFYSNQSSILEFSTYYYLYVKSKYLKATHHYEEALTTLDIILDNNEEQLSMRLKIEILDGLRRFKETIPVYRQLYKLSQIKNNKSLIRQINNLNVLYEKNNQIIRDKEVKINNMRAEEKYRFLLYSICTSIILLIIVFILLRYLRRSYMLKRDLEKEKRLLIEAEKRLNKEKMKAEEANHMKNIFIANISHEIRTPLNAIVGFSTLLSEEEFKEDEKNEFISLINKNSALLLSLVNDVLDLSKMETAHFKPSLESCELAAQCQMTLDVIKQKLAPEVTLTFNAQVEPFKITTDTQLLHQLLYHLLDNAVKFSPRGEINLSYEIDSEHEQVRFAVSDTGIGIPRDKREKIFERFEKLDEYSQGAGLGLAICQVIAKNLHGSVFVDVDYTNGARFIFIHPLNIEPESDMD